jgi:MEMO1 family protein
MEMYSKYIDRQPVAAGRFYSANANKLELEIEELIQLARQKIKISLPPPDQLMALVSPHAGYVFSGSVAASVFGQLQSIKPRKKIFLIGSSHHTNFNGASIYNEGNYITPLGKVRVDIELANEIIGQSPVFDYVRAAHAHEHGLEVLLPFVQYIWHDDFEIVPVIIATHQPGICKQIASILYPYFVAENLFVISTDLSHYPGYTDAVTIDHNTVSAVANGDPEKFLEQMELNKKKNIPNLATSMCGWTSVLTLLYMLEEKKDTEIVPVLYQNSGDAKSFSDKESVVGYQSLAIYKKEKTTTDDFALTEADKQTLIDIAKKSIGHFLQKGERFKPDSKNYSENLQKHCGAFVSIYLGNNLQGCIGRMYSEVDPLVEVIADMAVSSAFYDNRFPSLEKRDLPDIQIEISVLSPLNRINSPEELILGKHGIYIEKDNHSGTYLPQVANKTNWTKEEFISHCSHDKAGMGWDNWKNAEMYTYEAIIFKG